MRFSLLPHLTCFAQWTYLGTKRSYQQRRRGDGMDGATEEAFACTVDPGSHYRVQGDPEGSRVLYAEAIW